MKPKLILASFFILLISALTPSNGYTFPAPGAQPALAQSPAAPRPLTLPLDCAGGDCPLLTGAPQTAGMRSGFVRLKPGATVGWHSTGEHEEALVIFRGKGEARIEGQGAMPIAQQMEVYIPPATRHNVANTGTEILEYVYVVAPIAKK